MLVSEDRSFKFRMEECDQCQIQTSSLWLELGQLPTRSLWGDGMPGERTICLAWLPRRQVGSMPVVRLLNLRPRAAQLPLPDSGVHIHQAAGDACCRRVAFCFLSREPPCQGYGLLQHIPMCPQMSPQPPGLDHSPCSPSSSCSTASFSFSHLCLITQVHLWPSSNHRKELGCCLVFSIKSLLFQRWPKSEFLHSGSLVPAQTPPEI